MTRISQSALKHSLTMASDLSQSLEEIALGDTYPVDALPVVRQEIAAGRMDEAYLALRSCVVRIIPEKGHNLKAWIAVMARTSLLVEDPVMSAKIDAFGDLLAVGLDPSDTSGDNNENEDGYSAKGIGAD